MLFISLIKIGRKLGIIVQLCNSAACVLEHISTFFSEKSRRHFLP